MNILLEVPLLKYYPTRNSLALLSVTNYSESHLLTLIKYDIGDVEEPTFLENQKIAAEILVRRKLW